jgi:flagellar operon protein
MVERLNPAGLPPPQGPRPSGAGSARPSPRTDGATRGGPSFSEVLQARLLETREGVRFSAHAQERIRLRAIELTPADLARLDEGVKRAAAKGARESLLLSEKAAFVVSVRNNTVITVVDSAHLRENVFTNIDSAVIL